MIRTNGLALITDDKNNDDDDSEQETVVMVDAVKLFVTDADWFDEIISLNEAKKSTWPLGFKPCS